MEARASVDLSLTSDAAEFVRFCYRRRHARWPELYDEMCLVASRGAFRGWGPAELAEHGVVLSLYGCPALAELVHRVLDAEGIPPPRVVLLPRRPVTRDGEEDSAVERRRILVRAMGMA